MRAAIYVALFASAWATGCTTDLGEGAGPQQDSIDQYIQSLPFLPVAPPAMVQGTSSQPARDGDYQCTTQNLQETRDYDEIVAYAANSDSMWPGALVSADSVLTGLFTQIVMPRSPATISVSLQNIAGTKKATITDPSLASYREALSGILDSEITGATAADISSQIEQVHSDEQLNLALGVQASWGLGVASLKSSFNFTNKQTRSHYLVKYTQAYYTVDFDAPQAPSAVFPSDVLLTDVKAHMDETRPPAYVSSVTYGRMVLFTFESAYSDEEMGAALDFAYNGGADVSGQVSVSYKDIISSSKITAFILGGDAGTAVQAIDSYDALIAFIKSGGNYSKDSPGAPIAYKLNYLKDNSPARMSETTNYDVQTCDRVSQKVQITLDSIAVDSGGSFQVYGDVSATGSSSAALWHRDSGSNVNIDNGQQLAQAGGLATVVIDVSPTAGATIQLKAHLYDHNVIFSDGDLGNQVTILPFETGWRKDSTVLLTGDGGKVRVNFTLAPI
ncbi:MAG TPA: thiol-activated cytolysin family protein [Kofleriaceae bacterium]